MLSSDLSRKPSRVNSEMRTTRRLEDYLERDKDTWSSRPWIEDVYKFMIQGTSIRRAESKTKGLCNGDAVQMGMFSFRCKCATLRE